MPPIMNRPVVRKLTFAPLPYETHPIDTYEGPQGWGPFNGAWTPWDWMDPADDISDHYGSGESNEWQFAPPYDMLTLFGDDSLDFVNNTSYAAVAQQTAQENDLAYTSTIANVVPRGGDFLSRLREIVSGNQGQGGQ